MCTPPAGDLGANDQLIGVLAMGMLEQAAQLRSLARVLRRRGLDETAVTALSDEVCRIIDEMSGYLADLAVGVHPQLVALVRRPGDGHR
jgi:hypothetical protein